MPEAERQRSGAGKPRVRERLRAFTDGVGELRHPLLAVGAIVAALVGFLGYWHAHNLPVLDSLYESLQLFAFQYDTRISPGWELNIARFLALGVSVYALGIVISGHLRDEVQRFQAQRLKRHVVVCGLGTAGALAVSALRREGYDVVAIEENEASPNIAAARKAGALALKGDARDPRVLRRAGLLKAMHLLVMCGDDERNTEVMDSVPLLIGTSPQAAALASAEELDANGAASVEDEALECVVEVVDLQLGDLLLETSQAHDDRLIHRERFNALESGARAMLDAYPPFDEEGLFRGETPHLLIVGLGDMGGALVALAALRWACVRPDKRLVVTVVDLHPTTNVAELKHRYSAVRDICDFKPIERDVRKTHFWARQEFAQHAAFTSAYICVGNDTAALSDGKALARLHPERPIVVRTAQHSSLARRIERASNDAGLDSGLLAFNVLERVCRPEWLLQSEQIARAIHKLHMGSQEARGLTSETSISMDEWEDLRPELRHSSRRSARDINVKLAAVGMKKVPFPLWDSRPVQLSPDDVEVMAKLEHQLWWDERAASGWTLGPVKNVEAKTHPNMVPWEELDEPTRDYDRKIVGAIPRILAAAGWAIAPLENGGAAQ